MEDENEAANFQLFRECLSTPLIEKSSIVPPKKARKARGGRKTAIKTVSVSAGEEPEDAAAELAEFVDVNACCINSRIRLLIKKNSISPQKSSQISHRSSEPWATQHGSTRPLYKPNIALLSHQTPYQIS